MKKAVALALTALFATSAFAGAADPGFYVGGGYGLTKSKIKNLDEKNEGSIDAGHALRAYGGYSFNRIVSLEGSYTKYGKAEADNGYSWDPTALALTANLGYTFDIGFRPFATVGLSYLDLNEAGSKQFTSDTGTAFRYGIGVEYMPAQVEGLGIRLAYEADAFKIESVQEHNSDTLNIGSLYLGASYKF
ncbi:porin family protein [Vibrio mediterranei]|uniref:porin family protein n=1 Tax=Vibrio mediterranei TaxID=689 RepID=UPI001EFD5EA9|nr:porin family protein [Vibrio mediterranei]MCG9624798.1 porin family protein [Vibrio mediterranei]